MDLLIRSSVYITGTLPSVLFYSLTHTQDFANDGVLFGVALLQLLGPVAHDGQHGTMIDLSVVATLSCYLAFGMIQFIHDRRLSLKKMGPFYNVIDRWNQRAEQPAPRTKEMSSGKKDIKQMRRDALVWLGRGALLTFLSTVPFGILDGFLRVCNPPPEGAYISSLLEKHHVPIKTLYYYGLCSIAVFLHLAIVPTFILLKHGINLSARILLCPGTLEEHHQIVEEFTQRPPLFDRPWASTSIYELWSRRWHHMFRWAFKDLVYIPIRRIFASYPLLGRALATMAVFVLSGLMHDYIVLAMVGYKYYWNTQGIVGSQTIFFVLQGLASVVSKGHKLKIPRWTASLLTWAFLLYTAPLFIEPYILIGLNRIAWIPGYPRFQDPYLVSICPYGSQQ